MNQAPRFRRTTTTRQRRRKTKQVNPRPLLFVTLAVLVAVVGFAVVTSGDGASLPCTEGACLQVTTSALGSGPATEAGGAAPCPYCNQEPSAWMRVTSTAPPQISGANAAVIEGSCGKLVYGLRQDERKPPASIAKIVTAIVSAEQGRLSDRIDVKVNGWDLSVADGSSVAGLEAGMNLSLEDLLYALMLPSGNDAAQALSDNFGGGTRFSNLMNGVVKRLGLTNSRFLNADGRDKEGSYTSAFDIALLGRDLMANPSLRKIAGTKTMAASWDGHTLWNTNYLVYGYPGALGVKFGYTEAANETIVGAAERNGREVYVSVLDSGFAYLDAVKLLDWTFNNTKPSC